MEKKSKTEVVVAVILITIGFCITYCYLYLDPSTSSGIGKSEGLLGLVPTTIGFVLLLKMALRETPDCFLMDPHK